MEIYVVTNPELGWDCIVGVFKADDVSRHALEQRFPSDDCYVIHEKIVEKDLGDYYD